MSDRLAEIKVRLEDIPGWPYCDTQQARADIEWLIADNERLRAEIEKAWTAVRQAIVNLEQAYDNAQALKEILDD